MDSQERLDNLVDALPGTYAFIRPGDIVDGLDFPCAVPALRVTDSYLAAKKRIEFARANAQERGSVLCKVTYSTGIPVLFVVAVEPGDIWSCSLRPGDEELTQYLRYCLATSVFPMLLVSSETLCLQLRTFRAAQVEAALAASCKVERPSAPVFAAAVQALVAGKDTASLVGELFDAKDYERVAQACAIAAAHRGH